MPLLAPVNTQHVPATSSATFAVSKTGADFEPANWPIVIACDSRE